jgi:hypothetical protein
MALAVRGGDPRAGEEEPSMASLPPRLSGSTAKSWRDRVHPTAVGGVLAVSQVPGWRDRARAVLLWSPGHPSQREGAPPGP